MFTYKSNYLLTQFQVLNHSGILIFKNSTFIAVIPFVFFIGKLFHHLPLFKFNFCLLSAAACISVSSVVLTCFARALGPLHLSHVGVGDAFYKSVTWCQFFFFFWPRCVACGLLVPPPGIEPLAVEAQSLNHWTTREVPGAKF